jgi:hypothetical protein
LIFEADSLIELEQMIDELVAMAENPDLDFWKSYQRIDPSIIDFQGHLIIR